ncbi:hypothetical protein [Janthinobacterium agaricidamnosum]|uniref:Uncharacterized protein n=1 Tax=Janthinobacterium agaricidamnosum NBRC 102515 = DSM 9628 TaxID=1349767 RepID=W0V2T4_9BURK|nr:hypothetical protein [Janthinobacterium agaricidamnosum]CDG81663.1 hypothetical protein GJA_1008 [Janthinobacterium agaricidamnosum NBRC 102515 = DSM 9628]
MANTVFTYQFTPGAVQANTRGGFNLQLTNGSSAIALTPDDEIYLALAVGDGGSDLTPNLSDIGSQPPNNDWRFSKNPSGGQYNFIISPLDNITLAANASLSFTLSSVIINPQAGTSAVLLQEFVAGGDAGKSFPVSKSEAKLSIVAQAIPSKVGKTQATTLKWSATKAAYVTIAPLDLRVDTRGQIDTVPYLDVTPPAPQVSYTFTAWTQDQQFATDIVVVTISPPVIRDFGPQNLAPINYDDSVTLAWAVDYAETVMLVLPQGPVLQPPVASLAVQPKTMLSGNSSTATYTLRATGTGNPVLAYVRIPFKPVAIDYFRYPGFGQTSSFQFHVTNGNGQVVLLQGDQGPYYRLTASGPYGPLVQYLGNYPQVQVQVFIVTPAGGAPGAALKLEWQVCLASSLSLEFDGASHAIAAGQIAKGSFTVTPQASTLYTLSATDTGGRVVTSSLLVTIAG